MSTEALNQTAENTQPRVCIAFDFIASLLVVHHQHPPTVLGGGAGETFHGFQELYCEGS